MEPNQNQSQGQTTGQWNTAPSEKGGSAKTLWSVIILVVVIGGGWYLYKAGVFTRKLEKAPELTREQLVGEVPVSADTENAIMAHKQEILTRVANAAPLTPQEREALGRLMLMEAHLYQFTSEETKAIYERLKP